MPRIPVIAGNWKMNTTLHEATSLAESLERRLTNVVDIELVICPPFTNLQAVRTVISAGPIKLGAQDVFWERQGAFTGEISSPMLQSLGVEYVITGHSERRRLMGETCDIVNRKTRAALAEGLSVIVAVGETGDERGAGATEEVLRQQLAGSLSGLPADSMQQVIVAYEPVWAIGTGQNATPGEAQDSHAFIRGWLDERFDTATAVATRIQYGGSVTPENAAGILEQPDIDGALVGGASLDAGAFAAIVTIAERLQPR